MKPRESLFDVIIHTAAAPARRMFGRPPRGAPWKSVLLIAAIMAVTGVAFGQPVISLPDTTAREVDTLLIPLSLSGLGPSDEIYGVEATFAFGTPDVSVIGVESAGTLSAGSSVVYFSGTSKLAIALTTPITTDGVIVSVRVAVKGSRGYTYGLPLTGLKLNEGTPAVSGDNGSLYIRYLSVQPYSPTTIVVGDTVQFSVTGSPVAPVAWSSSVPSVGSIDSTGRFIAHTEGVLRVRATDAEGKRDSTDQFGVHPVTLRTLTVSVPDTSQTQTREIGIPVRITDVSGLEILSAKFGLHFDEARLQYLGISTDGTLTELWGAPTVNSSTPGLLRMALAGAEALTGSGALVVVRFRVLAASVSTSTLTLSDVELNEGILASVDNGVFTPIAAPVIQITMDRLSALQTETVSVISTTGGTGPYVYLSSDTAVASVDSTSGTLRVLTRGPVRVLAVDTEGFPGGSDTIQTYDFPATLGSATVSTSDSADIPLTVGLTTGLGIISFEFSLAYDTSVVSFRSIVTDGHLSDGFSVDTRDSAGKVLVAAAGSTPLTGSGSLLALRFDPATSATGGDSTALTLSSITFNEPSPSTPRALPVQGGISIGNLNNPPVFTAVLTDTTIVEGDTLRFSYVAADPDGDILRYTLLQGGSMATLDSVAGLLTFVAAVGSAGPHAVEARVSDGELSATTSAVVVVAATASNDSSLILDGSGDRARITDAAPVNPSANPSAYQISGTAITVEAWVYPMDAPAPGQLREIVTRPPDNGYGVDPYRTFGLSIIGADGFSSVPVLAFIISDGTTPIGGAGEIAVRDTAAVKVGEWTHVAGTYDGANVNLYINGVLARSLPFTAAIGTGSTGLYIGGHAFGAFRGLIDEVRLWNVTRSLSDLQNAKDVVLTGSESGLAGYWPFDSTYVSGASVVTVDASPNRNDLVLQFQARLAGFPQGSTVQIAPTNLGLVPAAVGGGYALTETPYDALLVADGWPAATITVTQTPASAIMDGDSIHWTPGAAEYGWFPFAATLTNTAGSISDTVSVFVEAVRTSANQVAVDVSHRGKIGAFGSFGKGVTYNGKNGLYAGDFSLVDRNDGKFAGGLYSTLYSFQPAEAFSDVPSTFADFTAFKTSFTDGWEPNPIGVRVVQTTHVKTTAPDDKYTIIEYRIVNESGSPIDDLFAQMSADFDIGVAGNNLGGYDSTLGLTYSYESGGATNSHYYGFQLLSHSASGAAVIAGGQDTSWFRSTSNLTTFAEAPASPTDTRNQIGAGPFALAIDETLTVAFAYLAGDDLDQLRAAAQAARDKYVTPGAPNIASLMLDGSGDRARISDNSPINPSADPSGYQVSGTSITVEAWVYPMDAPAPGQMREIITRPPNNGFGVDPYRTFGLGVIGADAFSSVPVLAFMLSDGTTPIGGPGEIAVRDTAVIKVGEWTHVAGTYDGVNAKLYINGVLVRSLPFTASIGTGSTGLYIGGHAFGYFRGLIDEVRLWNVTRSAGQVENSRDITLQGNEAGLAGYWPFDQTYLSGPSVVTPDLTSNQNDLIMQFDAKLAAFPQGSSVLIAPTNLSIIPGGAGGGYALTEIPTQALLLADGWPLPTINVTQKPATMTIAGDSVHWTPAAGDFGWFPIVATVSNAAGSIGDTVSIFAEAVRSSNNQVTVDVTHRGKIGAFGNFGKGVTYNGKNGLYTGDFSLVDRNDTKFAGGLYSTQYSFQAAAPFSDASSRFPDFTAFSTSFTDAWEPNRIGVRVFQTAHVKTTTPDDKYTIIEYRIVNESGLPIDDLFAQMSADFDVGSFGQDLGGFDTSLALTYTYESGGANNNAYYGFQLLGRPASGGGAIQIGQDTSWFRSTSNLTTFAAPLIGPTDTRNQITAGPFSVAVNETLTVAFAYLAGDDLLQLKAAAQAAKTIYGNFTTSATESDDVLPREFALSQNYPNPFNPSTTIGFALPTASSVRLEVFNTLGQSVGVVHDGPLQPGFHSIQWQSDAATGMYFYRIEAVPSGDPTGRFVAVKRMVLVR